MSDRQGRRAARGGVVAAALLVVAGVVAATFVTSGNAAEEAQTTARPATALQVPAADDPSAATEAPTDPGEDLLNPDRERAPDELAPATIEPVDRGKTKARTVDVAPGTRQTPATYPDGVELEISQVTQETIEDRGPGAFTGDPVTLITLTVSNGSDRPLSLNAVVPTLAYGDPARLAKPVYTEGTSDFGGTLDSGATTTATYGFSIPDGHRAEVSLHLDIDAQHQPAVLTGDLSS